MESGSFDSRDLQVLWNEIRGDVLRRGADEQTAEDVVQETWLRVVRKRPPDRGQLRGWLHVVAMRLLRDQRSTARHRRQREHQVARPDSSFPQSPDDDSVLLQRVRELPEPYGSVVRMRFLEDRDVAEIARLLHRPQETVRSQLGRGLERLRARLRNPADDRPRKLIGLVWLRLFGEKPSASRHSLARSFSLGALGIVALLGSWTLWDSAGTRSPPIEVPAFAATVDTTRSLALESPERAAIPGLAALPASEPPGLQLVRLAGCVRSPDGMPVPGAEVHAARANADRPSRSVLAQENGRYEIVVERHDLLWATHESWGASRRCYVASPQDMGELDLFLFEMRGQLDVVVHDHQGAPVADARVLLDPDPALLEIVTTRGTLEFPNSTLEATTDAEGRARMAIAVHDRDKLVDFGEERPTLIVLAPGLPSWSGEYEPPEREASLSIVLPRPGVVRGTCSDAAGPAWNARVELLQLGGRVALESVTGPDGTFEIGNVAPGEFVVRVHEDPARGSLSARQEGFLEEGRSVDVALTLDAGSTIQGRVLDPRCPLPGATVSLQPLDPVAAEGRQERIVQADEAGRFAFGGCTSRDRYRLRATAPGCEFPGVALEPVRPNPEELVVALALEQALAPIAVEFSGPRERRPRSIELFRNPPPFSLVLDRSSGSERFLSPPLPAGVYGVVGWAPDLGTWSAGTIKHIPGSGSVNHLATPEPGTLEVEIDLPHDVAPDDVWVHLRVPGFNRHGSAGLGKQHGLRELQWDAERRAFSAEVAAGDYVLGARAQGLLEATQDVQVAARDVTRVRLTMLAGIDTKVVLRSPRDLSPFEYWKFQMVVPGRGVMEVVRAPDNQRKTEGVFEFDLRLPRTITQLRAVSWRRPETRAPRPIPTRLDGRRLIGLGDLAPGESLPRLEIQLVERAN